ncbi:conjugative transposon protein TraM [Bacteroides fragilis]|uniref:conjugative transposon protein TraM n=1 Tax=Bacteroides fragilis TaxID=817 RepID=UPI00245462CB|nr:conjugative transposon protein TraM [Bacteroides fragilis]
MTRDGKSRIAILAGLGIVVVLLVWAFIASLPASGSKEPETGEVILRTRIKDSFTLDDMLQKVGKENTSKSASLSGFDPVTEEPADTAGNEREIRRIQELIRDNERELGAGITVPVQQPVASRGKEKPALQEKKEEEVRPGQRIRKGTPVFGEVTGIDGERVLVKITSVNLGGNILPFEKQVYSEDAIQGIYVPGNVKAETAQEAGAAGISGANTNISGGFDMGSQLVAGAANSVINATKSAASKNIRKVKVTIKTNYRILLRQPEE